MSARARSALSTLLLLGALSGSLLAVAAPGRLGGSTSAQPPALSAVTPKSGGTAKPAESAPLPPAHDLEPLSYSRSEDGRLFAELPDGDSAELTLDPDLQAHLEGVFRRYEVPYGAAVAIEPSTGRVLAYVSHSSANPDAGDLARDPTPPSASVFKVITAAALVDRGVAANTKVCYGGGLRRLTAADLADNPKRDRSCATLSEAMGGSINAVFAKLADRHLDGATLERYAEAFGFGHALPFDAPTRASRSEVPQDRLEFARTAAGFWHMHMSPLHGALIASTVANGGVMQRPGIIERVMGEDGRELRRFEPKAFRSVIPRSTARVLGTMMQRTVTHGTSRKAFYDLAGRPFLPGIKVAGKTGSLASERPYRAYNWWVGYAPMDKPKIAVSALVVNTPKWRIKGSYVGREALRRYLLKR